MHLFLERENRGLNLGLGKSDKVLPTARHPCDISLKGAVCPGAMMQRWDPQTRNTLRRNAAGIMQGLMGFDFKFLKILILQIQSFTIYSL